MYAKVNKMLLACVCVLLLLEIEWREILRIKPKTRNKKGREER